MQLVSVGANYTSAPLAIRERLALHGQALDAALARLKTGVGEGFVLSTCNRTEVYALVGHADSGTRLLTALLAECAALSVEELAPALCVHTHEAAVRHLFGVAGGVHSMVPGEDQILAQLKAAVERGAAAGTLGASMHRLGAAALGVGKRVRAETVISRHSLSIVSVALKEAGARLGALTGRRVLVVGAGHTAELALKHLAGGRAASCTVVNRGAARATELGERYGVRVARWEALEPAMAAADLVLGCTSAPGFVIDRAAVGRVQHARGGAPLVLMDLAIPRDIDPAAAEVDGVTLWDIARLEAVCQANRALRTREIGHAEAIIAEHTERYMAWWSAREVAPTITALLARATEIRDAEVERTLARLPNLSAREQLLVRTLAARVLNKLLRTPLTVLKEHPEAGNMATELQQLFGLQVGAPGCDAADASALLDPSAVGAPSVAATPLACPRVEPGEP